MGSSTEKRYLIVIRFRSLTSERTVKRLRLSKALTIPDHTTVREACRRMASRRVDAVLLTDSNALLCGILTDKVSNICSSSLAFSCLCRLLCVPGFSPSYAAF